MRLINSRSCSLFFQVKSYEIILKGHRTIIVSIHEFPVSVTCSQLVHTKPQALQLWVVSWHHRTPDPLSWSYKNNFIVLKILWNHYVLYVLKTRGTFSFLHIIYPRQPSRPIYAFPFSLCQSQLLPIFVMFAYWILVHTVILILLFVILIVIFTFSETLLPFHCNRRNLILLLAYYVARNLQVIDINFSSSFLVQGQ